MTDDNSPDSKAEFTQDNKLSLKALFLKGSQAKRRSTALGLCAASSLFLISIGCEVAQHPPKDNDHQDQKQGNKPAGTRLVIIPDEVDVTAVPPNEEEMSVIQFLTSQKAAQGRRLQTLADELEETKARLEQIKKEIVIKGGVKEQEYLNRIQTLETQISQSQFQLKPMEERLREQERALNERQETLDTVFQAFNKSHLELSQQLDKTKQELLEERESASILRIEMENKVNDLQSRFTFLSQDVSQQAITRMESSVNEKESTIQQLKKELNETHSNYTMAQNQLAEMETNLRSHQSELERLNAQLAVRGQEQNSSAQSRIAELEREVSTLRMSRNGNSSDEVLQLRNKLARSENEAKEMERLLSMIQKDGISALQIHRTGKEADIHKESLLAAQRELLELSEEYAHLDDKYSSVEHEFKHKIAALQERNAALEKQLENSQEVIATAHDNSVGIKDERYKRLNATLEHVTASLEREKSRRRQVEDELLAYKETSSTEVMFKPMGHTVAINESELQSQFDKLLEKYEEEKQRGDELESKVHAMGRWAGGLQEEIQAHEAVEGFSSGAFDRVSGVSDGNLSKLKAKIAYLTTRLAQEKNKAMGAEEKLMELEHEMEALRDQVGF